MGESARRWRRRLLLAAAAGSLTLAGGALPSANPAKAAATVRVLQADTYRTRLFPDDRFSVADPTMLTGRRVNLRQGVDFPACDATNYSVCDGFRMLDQLDGFDLQPRVTVPFSAPIDVGSVNADDVFVEGPGGRTALVQLVWDPATKTLAGLTNAFLAENSRYQIVVTSGVRDSSGNPI